MKHALLLPIVLFPVCSMLYSCSLESEDYLEPSNLSTKSVSGDGCLEDFSIGSRNLDCYVHHKELISKYEKTDFSLKEIIPMSLEDGETLGYVLNYGTGWELIASDKRAPLVLAKGEEENFDPESSNSNMMYWINTLLSDVKYLKSQEGYEFTEDEDAISRMKDCVDFWKAIEADKDFIESHRMVTKSDPTPPGYDGPYTGHWEYRGVINQSYSTNIVPHLIRTSWGQGTPYNDNYPTKSTGYGHVPAACSAVALGQMLLFCYEKFGVPSSDMLYVKYNCTLPTITPTVSATPPITWNDISLGYSTSIASCLANLAMRLGVSFSDTGSGVNTVYQTTAILYAESLLYDTVNPGSNYFGSNCFHIKNDILAGMPVILQGFDGSVNGHAFIADGFETSVYSHGYQYEWVYDDAPSGIIPSPPTEIIYDEYSETDYVRINWGWGGTNNSNLYRLTGSWATSSGTYDDNRAFIYNIHPMQ